jgi:hypothetical protein
MKEVQQKKSFKGLFDEEEWEDDTQLHHTHEHQ